MTTETATSTAKGSTQMTTPTVVAELIARSNELGADPRNTNYAGGNTSAKGSVTDPVTQSPVDLLWVKGSGGDLGTLTESGLAVLRLDRLRDLVDVYPGVEREDEMVAVFDFTLHGRGGAAPSIDTAMHGLVDAAHVDHLHPDSGIAFATAKDGETLLGQGAQVAAGALDPQQLDRLAGDGVGLGALGGGVAAGVVGVLRVGAEAVRPRDQLFDGLVRHGVRSFVSDAPQSGSAVRGGGRFMTAERKGLLLRSQVLRVGCGDGRRK